MTWYVHRRDTATGRPLISWTFSTVVDAARRIHDLARVIAVESDCEIWLWNGVEYAITPRPHLARPSEIGLLGGDIA